MIELRPAHAHDWARLFAWRNDPDVCRQFLNGPVALPDHLAWFTEMLQPTSPHKMFIAEDYDNSRCPVGVVRLMDRPGAWSISILVDARCRRIGCGADMIREVLTRVDRPIIAEVKIDNYASLRAFAANGFTIDSVGDLVVLKRDPLPVTKRPSSYRNREVHH